MSGDYLILISSIYVFAFVKFSSVLQRAHLMDLVGVGVVEEGQEEEVFCATMEFPVTHVLAHMDMTHTSFCSICIA